MSSKIQGIDARGWHADDDSVYTMLKQAQVPALLAMNKHDLVKSKSDLLPQIAALSNSTPFEAFVPVCAKNGKGVEDLRRVIVEIAPLAPVTSSALAKAAAAMAIPKTARRRRWPKK